MNTEKAYRILDAFEAFCNGTTSYEAVDSEQTSKDAIAIRGRYSELRHQMNFTEAEAVRIAKVEFMIRVMEEK